MCDFQNKAFFISKILHELLKIVQYIMSCFGFFLHKNTLFGNSKSWLIWFSITFFLKTAKENVKKKF